MTFDRRGSVVIWVLALFLTLAGVRMGSAQPRLDLNHTGASAALKLTGTTGHEYILEAASGGVGATNWGAFGSFVLTNSSRTLSDPNGGAGAHFFRARERGLDEIDWSPNFRLIDQNSKSRELFYYFLNPALKGVVLVFAQGDYSVFASKINALAANTLFKTSILFWGIDTDPNNTRTNIAKAATTAGITWPVFHDGLQLDAASFNAHFNGEVVLIDTDKRAIVYRGMIDDGAGNAYLADALTNLVGAKTITTTRMEPARNPMNRLHRPIADYATVIAPMVKARCVICHSEGNIAPIVFNSYQSLVDHLDAVKDEILSGRMPPWQADPNYGIFRNDISLSATEKSQLIDWANAGMPRGSGPDGLTEVPPAPPHWPAELGEPDQVVRIPLQSVPAGGTIAYRYIYANATNSTDRWLRAAIVRPGNPRVVHHYIVWEGHSNFAQLSGIAGYAPGKNEQAFPSGTGILLKANSDLTFNIHYTATGYAETDQPELGLWYASTPPARTLQQAAPLNFFSIPPGNPEYQVTASQTFSSPATIFSFSPHMHVRGLRMRFDLVLPNGTKSTLLSVPNYDFHWQTIYNLATPIEVPANSRVDIVGAFDNSVMNHHNPDPTKSVVWGEQSWDEMFIGYIEYANR